MCCFLLTLLHVCNPCIMGLDCCTGPNCLFGCVSKLVLMVPILEKRSTYLAFLNLICSALSNAVVLWNQSLIDVCPSGCMLHLMEPSTCTAIEMDAAYCGVSFQVLPFRTSSPFLPPPHFFTIITVCGSCSCSRNHNRKSCC